MTPIRSFKTHQSAHFECLAIQAKTFNTLRDILRFRCDHPTTINTNIKMWLRRTQGKMNAYSWCFVEAGDRPKRRPQAVSSIGARDRRVSPVRFSFTCIGFVFVVLPNEFERQAFVINMNIIFNVVNTLSISLLCT